MPAAAPSFVLVPRCVPWDAFTEFLGGIRKRFPGCRMAVFEANPGNLRRYAPGIQVLQYRGARFFESDMRAQLEGKLDWRSCAAVVVPLGNDEGRGYEQLIGFARGCSGIPAFVMAPDLSLRSVSYAPAVATPATGGASLERAVLGCFRARDGALAIVGRLPDGGSPAERLAVCSDSGPAQVEATVFRYPCPDYGAPGEEAGIAVFIPPGIPALGLRIRCPGGSEFKIDPDTPSDPSALMEEFVVAFNRCRHAASRDVERRRRVEEHFLGVITALNAAANDAVSVIAEHQFGVAPAHPKVSIVVPFFGAYDLIRHQLSDFSSDAFLKQQELILVLHRVDDEQDDLDRFKVRLHRLHDLYGVPVRLLVTNRTCGFSMACNIGATAARADCLLLLNSDVFPKTQGWLEMLVSDLGSDPSAGIVGARLLYPDESVQHVGLTWRRDPALQDLPVNYHPYKGMSPTLVPCGGLAEVHAVTGACMMFRTAEYRALGMLDTGFIRGDYEDSDICLRFRARGMRTVCDNRVELYHLEGASWASDLRHSLHFVNARRHEQRWGRVISELIAQPHREGSGDAATAAR